ncbi:hypothetical protein EVC45_42105 [Paraburkholderia sp. UYCP14C]|nr:hypothetical protein EVC45_42105 [Paraburkholderia sp. UYCP14C]
MSLGKRRSSCFKSRTTNLLADPAADTPNVKKNRRFENVLCRPSLTTVESHYAVDNLPNKVLAAEYRAV